MIYTVTARLVAREAVVFTDLYRARPGRAHRSPVALAAIPLAVCAVFQLGAKRAEASPAPVPFAFPAESTLSVNADGLGLAFLDSLLGRSGKLRAHFITRQRSLGLPLLQRLFGDSAAERPGVYAWRDSLLSDRVFNFITMRPFTDKIAGRIGGYRIGAFPSERRHARTETYVNPEGFIEVTPSNIDTPVSEHFRLGDFMTHDQQDVWPKYLVLNERLVDKLELVIQDLNAHGIPVRHLTIMSGFRTPEYNVRGVGRGGRAKDSRHQFGDAADVFVDNNGTGRGADLNHDGRVDYRDARVVMQSVNRVEAAHPELAGGCGVYRGTRAHGPFTHIDARGSRARWGLV
ncbi:MAG: hypothetical protein M3068_09895 [Gemmatimonadota bacterium]|nr:hypothetical protein [Gemmatimonadota bacterium]